MPIDTDMTALIVALPLAWALLVIVMRGLNRG